MDGCVRAFMYQQFVNCVNTYTINHCKRAFNELTNNINNLFSLVVFQYSHAGVTTQPKMQQHKILFYYRNIAFTSL